MHAVECLMKSLQVNNLLLYPRIRKSIKDSLDKAEHIRFLEEGLEFSQRMDEMQKVLIELL